MKVVVIGFGQCGCNIADSFAQINRRARTRRGMEIVTGAFAVNTDLGDLSSLSHIRPDFRHRILIGGRRVGGHGVGKVNELGAEVAREDADKVIDALRAAPRLYDSDAFLLIGGAAGGTGSGALPVMAQAIRERHRDRPVYGLVVLPFEHEEQTEERTIFNSATCLKSTKMVCDAVFLVDNERYASKDSALRRNRAQINSLVAEAFYDLLCSGEEKKAKYLGVRLLDAGDIIQTLTGWTAIGRGRAGLPALRLPFLSSRHFRRKDEETHRGVEAMDQSMSELSVGCDPADAGRALFLVTGPSSEMSLTVIQETGARLRSLAPEAVIRNGDYPRGRSGFCVSVILSDLRHIEKVNRYYAEASSVASRMRKKEERARSGSASDEDRARDVPTLI